MPVNFITHRRTSGFTLLELVITLLIGSIVSVIAIPSMGEMYKEYKLRSATQAMVAALQDLKLRAVKENARTVMIINETNDTYTTFLDSFVVNWALDTPELIDVVDLSAQGIEIQSNFAFDTLGFNSKGMPATGVGGTIELIKDGSRKKNVIINTAGNIRVTNP